MSEAFVYGKLTLALALAPSGCAMASDPMDSGDGVYMISAHASAIRGGATGANELEYSKAKQFCVAKGSGLHPVLVNDTERDVYQSSFGGSWNTDGGSGGGGSSAAGNVYVYFKCST